MSISIDDIANGQKIVIYAIIANFIVNAMRRSTPELGLVIVIPTLIIAAASIYGVYRLSTGLGYPLWQKILLCVIMFVPLANLITLVILSLKATKQLKLAGYEVGLLGVKS